MTRFDVLSADSIAQEALKVVFGAHPSMALQFDGKFDLRLSDYCRRFVLE
jgi:hypothetical protein